MNDPDLLRRFVAQSDHDAFAKLVQRHIDFVYAAALRHMHGDSHHAEDVTQQVFIDLARKASMLTEHPCLLGWLYASTRFTATNTIRSEQRRSTREQEAETMQDTTTAPEPQWDHVRALIDDAMQDLDECDRQAVLMRFFGRQKYAEIGEQFGMSENAVQKRVDRALDLLNAALVRRGVKSTSAALAVTLSEVMVAAPGSLAQSVTAAALAGCVSGVTGLSSFMGAAKVLAGIAVAGVASFAVGVWYHERLAAEQMDQQKVEFVSKLSAAEARLRKESTRADLAEADTAKLLGAIAESRARQADRGPMPSPPREQQATHAAYFVQRGDTVTSVAEAAGVSVEAMKSENDGYNFTRMRVGDQIAIPPGGTVPAIAAVPSLDPAKPESVIPPDSAYVVRLGDTATNIAASVGLTLEQLKSLNPTTNWSRLKAGQQIRVR